MRRAAVLENEIAAWIQKWFKRSAGAFTVKSSMARTAFQGGGDGRGYRHYTLIRRTEAVRPVRGHRFLLGPSGFTACSDSPVLFPPFPLVSLGSPACPPVPLVSLSIPPCILRPPWCLLDHPCALQFPSPWCLSRSPHVSSGAPSASWVLRQCSCDVV